MKLATIAIAVVTLAIPAAASADPGNGHGQGHDKQNGASAHSGARHQGSVRAPPGLAKKPYGMPPGQAKKVWQQGQNLPNQYYTQSRYYVANPSAVNLGPAPYGSRWVRVGDNYYLAQTQTGAIGQIVSALMH